MTLSYPNPFYNKVFYKGTALEIGCCHADMSVTIVIINFIQIIVSEQSFTLFL